MAISEQKKARAEAGLALSRHIALSIISNAKDNGEDPLTYATDQEVVMIHAKDLAKDVSEYLPELIKELAGK